MSVAPENRTLLNVFAHARGKRLPITCELKCGNACDHPVPNQSDNDYFRDIASAALSRRAMLGGTGAAFGLAVTGASAAAATSEPDTVAATAPAQTTEDAQSTAGRRGRGRRDCMPFTPIAPVDKNTDGMTVPEGYNWHPIIKWGDPIIDGAPEFDPNNQTPEAQAGQFGYNNDYLDILPINRWNTHALLCCNHEYTNENIMFDLSAGPTTDDQKRIAMAAHGFSVVELQRRCRKDRWEYLKGAPRNRRFTLDTEFAVDGPAAGHDLLKTKADPTGTKVLGTLNNCSGGTTPWGTILTGEENFNQYFVAEATTENRRYGISDDAEGNRRKWWTADPRWDARTEDYKNEPHRFGWVVEIDPHDPTSTPVKHTALGRFKHEAANVRLTHDRRVAAYSGDDERFDYLYKFVSKNTMCKGDTTATREQNKTLLSEGNLYVAKFAGDSPREEITGDGTLPSDGHFDGWGKWVPLVENGESRVDGMSVAEVLVFTRIAADKVKATKLDRPEDVEPNPLTGRVYVACTNNKNRGKDGYPGADEVNPRVTNREGHVIEITEDRNDAGSLTFKWNLLLVCGDPESAGTYFGGYTGEVSPISCPDNLAFDSQGTLWISTDGQPGTIGYCDALHKVTLRGTERGKVEQFLAVPREAETCGPVIHDREATAYVCVQHPGEGGTWAEPTSVFPDYDTNPTGWQGPRPTVVQVGKFPSDHRPSLKDINWGDFDLEDIKDALRALTGLTEEQIEQHAKRMRGMSTMQAGAYMTTTLGVTGL